MKLKLFKKFFFTTGIIIIVSFSIMMLILSLVLNSYISHSHQKTLNNACNEAVQYIQGLPASASKEDLKYSVNILNSISDVSGSDIFIADYKSGRIFVCGCEEYQEKYQCMHTTSLINKSKLHNYLNNDSEFLSLDTLEIYSKPHYIAAKPISNDNDDKFAVLFVTAPVTAAQNLLSTVTKLYIASAILPIIIMFLAIYIMTYRLTKPLKLMSEASKAMAKGDFSKRIPVTSDDEIGELATSFNMMTNSLAKLEGMRKSFVANVSHELKTPMTTIGGFIDGILDGTIESERQSYYLAIVSDEVKRLSRLVQSMLSMARLESGEFSLKPELFDLRELLFTIVVSQEQRIEEKNLQIIGLDTLQNISITADKDLIHQSIYNLVDNAVKFTNPNGKISFSLKKENKTVIFTITNTGKGIPEKDLPFIFERFYKVDKSRSASKNSTGIGLYIVKTIITSHGGRVSVMSKEDEFTVFKITLPNQ